MIARSSLLILAVALALSVEEPSAAVVPSNLGTLLAAARGVPDAVCVLAADGVASGGWGSGFQAPALPVRSDLRASIRALREGALSSGETRGLVASLAASDACERHLAAVLLGRAGDRSVAPEIAGRLASSWAPERAAALVALGMMEAAGEADAIARVLGDPSADVRANAAWALGRAEVRTTAPPVQTLLRDDVSVVRAAAA